MGQYLIDTNVISDFFSKSYLPPAEAFIEKVIDDIPFISVMTQIESLSWVTQDIRKEQMVRDFIQKVNVIPLTSDIVEVCVKIRRAKELKTPDAIIAASAVVNNLPIITRDKNFTRIKDLQVINPFAL